MSEKTKPEPAAPKKADVRPVSAWARATGNYKEPGRFHEGNGFSAAHNAADALHGWNSHAHHAAAELELTEDDYRAALAAAMPDKGNPRAHRPALSPHCTHDGGCGSPKRGG